MPSGPPLEPGTVVGGDFALVRLLGEGGMGAVYVAEQRSTGKLRALKVMHRDIAPDATLQRRFEQEAKVGSLIKSGHVVEVIAAGIDASLGLPYLVMELLEGMDLRRHLRERGRLPVDEVRAIFEQLCHGVGAAHAAGLVHRDLKPENIFLARPNRVGSVESVVKVLDFGIAKLAAETGTRATAALGSPLWMAPEQTAPGPVTPAADVWALGLIAYELLTGEHFWRAAATPTATPMHLLREIVLDPIPRASERAHGPLPPGFDPWFARCLARDPADRFQTATELWRAMGLMFEGATRASEPPLREATDPFAPTATASPFDSVPPAQQALGSTPLVIVGRSAPPPSDSTRETVRPKGSSRVVLAFAVLIAAGGIVGGVSIGECRPPVVTVNVPSLPSGFPGAPPSVVTTLPAMRGVPSALMPLIASSIAAGMQQLPEARATARHAASETTTVDGHTVSKHPVADESHASASHAGSLSDGFSNPHDGARQDDDIDAPRQTTVQGHRVRLFTRIVSNGSNVADAVVRSAIDFSSWEYDRCYEQAFRGAKDLTGGTVTVGFDILDQLPRHATLQSSTFGGTVMTPCVVQTLAGQTINAAGRDGAGHVVYGFRFVVMD
jgi:serine/threonine protein kinase